MGTVILFSMSNVFRSRAMARRYNAHKALHLQDPCALCTDNSIKDFTHWRVLENDFPYDVVAKTHHMIVPKRHITEQEIEPHEWAEFKVIKKTYMELYDAIIEGTPRMKSIPGHFHLHLIIERGN